MRKKKPKCETCQFRGYSSNFCKLHLQKVSKDDCESCNSHRTLKSVGKTAAVGAGFGAMATVAGMAAVPAVGLKAIIGHAVAAKIAAGGGVAGAGVNVARQAAKRKSAAKERKKRRVLLPLYLNKGKNGRMA
jgi:hypothetical protein